MKFQLGDESEIAQRQEAGLVDEAKAYFGRVVGGRVVDDRAARAWKWLRWFIENEDRCKRFFSIGALNFRVLRCFKEWHEQPDLPLSWFVNGVQQIARWNQMAPVPGSRRVVSAFDEEGQPIFQTLFLVPGHVAQAVCEAWNDQERSKGSRARYSRKRHKNGQDAFQVVRRTPRSHRDQDGYVSDSVAGVDRQGRPVFGAKRAGGMFTRDEAQAMAEALNAAERFKGSPYSFQAVRFSGLLEGVWKIQRAEFDYLARGLEVSLDALPFEFVELAANAAEMWN